MKKRGFIFTTISIIVLSLVVLGIAHFVKGQILSMPLKEMTEERLSSIFGVDISIGEIKFGVTEQISLSKLRVLPNDLSDQSFYLAGAKSIKLKYNLMSLINKDFNNPNKVILESPNLLIKDLKFPKNLFKVGALKNLEKPSGFMAKTFRLSIKDGRTDYPFMNNKYKVGLKEVYGVLEPSASEGAINVRLSAKGSGIFRGNMAVVGKVFPAEKKYDFHFRFKDNGEIFLPGFMKLKNIGGTFRFQPDKISFQNIKFTAADLIFEAKGEIINFESGSPQVNLSVSLLSKEFPHSIDLNLDFAEETIKGEAKSFDQTFSFVGDLFNEDGSTRVSAVELLNGFTMSADVNIEENVYQLSLDKDPFRLNVNFSFDDWDTVLYVNMEHAEIYGIDIVAFLKLRLTPTEGFKRGKDWKFNGSLKTDYLILDTSPANDLDGTFFIDHFSIKDIDLNWGENYRLTGGYNPAKPKDFNLTLNIIDIDLAKLKSMLFYTKPKEFGGVASGRIEVARDIRNPLIFGKIQVENGLVGKMSFEGLYMSFSGYYPYLKLKDSKAVRGGKDLFLEGNLNLNAKNIFQDLNILSDDHIVLWRGVVLNENLQDNLILLGKGIKKTLTE